MKKTLFMIIVLFLCACKKDFYKERLDHDVSKGNMLTLADARRFVKVSLNKDLSRKKIAKQATVNSPNIADITEHMADSIYSKFYWDYAVEEHNIDGHPAILVPIKMSEQINVSIADDMGSIGYRVAVLQHNPDKSDILISYKRLSS